MWTATVPAIGWAFIWFCGVFLLFVLVANRRASGLVELIVQNQRPYLLLFLIPLLVRLIPMLLLPVGAQYDIESFKLVGEALLKGEDIYTSAARGRHPYFPFQMYLLGASLWLARFSGVPFVLWVKLPALLADIGLTFFIYFSARRWGRDQSTAVTLALLYALNPISLLVSAYHGQFDAITLIFLFLAWYFWQFEQQIGRSAVALGFAIASKTWPVVFLPIMLIRLPYNRKRVAVTAVALGIPLLLTIIYLIVFNASSTPLLRRALSHTGVPGYWGLSAILTNLQIPFPMLESVTNAHFWLRRIMLIGMGLFILWWTRKESALNALVTIILAELAITVGIGIQWLLWIVPFAILVDQRRWLVWYSLTGSLMMLAQLYGIHLYPWAYELWGVQIGTVLIQLASLPAWIVVCGWLIFRLKSGKEKALQQADI